MDGADDERDERVAQEVDAPSALRREGPVCPQCSGAGFVRADVEVGHPEFGRVFPCACQTDALRDRRRRRYSAYTDLPAHRKQTFDAFVAGATPSLANASAVARAYAEAPRGWLVLSGRPGTGKTHLAAAIAHTADALGMQVFFLLVDRLLNHLRATYAPQSEVRAEELATLVIQADLLVLDDLRNSLVRPWARDQLFHLLDQRYGTAAPTVVTTNLSAAALADSERVARSARHGVEFYAELLDDRLRSRLLDRALVRWMSIDAPDYRRVRVNTRTHD
jgi:DNA replication protein DnaC